MNMENLSPDDDYEDDDQLADDNDDEQFLDVFIAESKTDLVLAKRKQKEDRERLERLLEERRLRKELDDDFSFYD